MFFVVDRPRLLRMIAITRDDLSPSDQTMEGPFFRIEASGDKVTLTGRVAQAAFPATVYEPGVLFLRITLFRRVLKMLTDVKFLSIQANSGGLIFDNIRMPLDSNDMLLYPNLAQAPKVHPAEAPPKEVEPPDSRDGTLWDSL